MSRSNVRRNKNQAWMFDKLIQALGADLYFPMTAQAISVVGPDIGADIRSVQGVVRRLDQIPREMKRIAEKRERMAIEADGNGHTMSAAEQYFAAALLYNFAQGPIHSDESDLNQHLSAKKNACYDQFIERAPRRIERVEVPFGDQSLPGILHFPQGAVGKVPCVVFLGGLDLFREMLVTFHGDKMLSRGIAVLALDGPGQNEALIARGIRCTADNFIDAGRSAMDYLLSRDDIDADRIGLVGVSMGSFWITQIAAHDHRYAAAAGFYVCHEPGMDTIFNRAIPVFKERYMWMAGIQDEDAFDQFATTLTLEGMGAMIECPYLIIAGENDELSPIQHTYDLYEEVTAPKTLIVYEDQTHGVADHNDVLRSIADWMCDRFADKPLESAIIHRTCRTGMILPS
jgi:dienelactone hydrolase